MRHANAWIRAFPNTGQQGAADARRAPSSVLGRPAISHLPRMASTATQARSTTFQTEPATSRMRLAPRGRAGTSSHSPRTARLHQSAALNLGEAQSSAVHAHPSRLPPGQHLLYQRGRSRPPRLATRAVRKLGVGCRVSPSYLARARRATTLQHGSGRRIPKGKPKSASCSRRYSGCGVGSPHSLCAGGYDIDHGTGSSDAQSRHGSARGAYRCSGIRRQCLRAPWPALGQDRWIKVLLLDLFHQRGAVHSQNRRSLVLVPTGALERLKNQLILKRLDRVAQIDALFR